MRDIRLERNTAETQIELTLDLDGAGIYQVDTGCGFLAFSRWSWEKYVSEKPRPGYRPLGLSYSAQGTYNGEEFLDAEQISKNKLYIYTREKNTSFDRRFLMKRVGEGWMIDAVQERLDGWQRTGL